MLGPSDANRKVPATGSGVRQHSCIYLPIAAAQQLYSAKFGPADALLHAQGSVYNLVLQQADYWAYMELFFVFVWVSAVGALTVGLFRGVKSKGPVALH